MGTKIQNPILRGFHPDPSMIYVDGAYYIATSTFEWYPGVQIYKSIDLVNWELASRPLNRLSLLNLKGNVKSGGVWAPCLTYSDGLFWLVYSDTKTWRDEPFKDVRNYITTCETIDGEWSEPVYVNSSGFDPSLFHDEDGKKYFVNMEWDHRNSNLEAFTGILVQEYDPIKKELVGDIVKVFEGTKRGLVEGPHIYKKDGYYYLFSAEGGTDTNHAESIARSKNVFGTYEVHPNELLITSLGTDSKIRKAGHGSICQNDEGKWYLAHLCGRYLNEIDRCPLGRETAIQEVVWIDDWPYLKSGTQYPEESITIDQEIESTYEPKKVYTFDDEDFLVDFQTLRIPYTGDIFSIKEKEGYLAITGKESPYSVHTQSLIARRQQDFEFHAETTLEFEPDNFQQMAGFSYRYDEDNQYYLHLTFDEKIGSKVVQLFSSDSRKYKYIRSIPIKADTEVTLGVDVKQRFGQFYYEIEGKKELVGDKVDISILSDEYADPMGFTGAFVGMMATDLQFNKKKAYFKEFIYEGFDRK